MSNHNDTVQRIQVGVVGLVSVLLLVSVANFMLKRASDEPSAIDAIQAEANDASRGTTALEEDTDAPAEPLAELGITPAPEPEEEVVVPLQEKGQEAQVVPDLKPDPKLEAPMDVEQ